MPANNRWDLIRR